MKLIFLQWLWFCTRWSRSKGWFSVCGRSVIWQKRGRGHSCICEWKIWVLKVSQRGEKREKDKRSLAINEIVKPAVSWSCAQALGCPAQPLSVLSSSPAQGSSQDNQDRRFWILLQHQPYLQTLGMCQELSRFLQAWEVGGKPWLTQGSFARLSSLPCWMR